MSERGVGAVERELLDRTRARLVALNAERFRLLEDIAELERRDVAGLTGDRSPERLVGELGRCDRGEAARLVGEARDLVARRALSGEPVAPRYPHTADALAQGAIGPAHVAVIRRAMGRLERLEHLAPVVVADAERFLAEKARELGPHGLEKAAAALLAYLDPDGVAPAESESRTDEVQVLRRRDGSLDLRVHIHGAADAAMIDQGLEVMATPAGPDDTRDLKLRRADGLKELFHTAHGHRHPGPAAVDHR